MTNSGSMLYCVSSVGLGHARRSLSIARKVRSLNPDVKIEWICAEPVLAFMKDAGERILDVSERLESVGWAMESLAHEGKIQDISKVARLSASVGKKNYQLIRPYLSSHEVLIQDESVETLFAFLWDDSPPLPSKRAVITDYVRFETSSLNPINRLVCAYANRSLRSAFMNQDVRIFADDPDALPNSESIRSWVMKSFKVTGPLIDDLPEKSGSELKQDLFDLPNERRLVLFTVGGTSIGRTLAEFVSQNAEEISRRLNAHLALLLGPRLPEPDKRTQNLTLVKFVRDSLSCFKAADCVVAQAGASTLNEIASLGVPCVCIPIANHWEQRQNANRFARQFKFEILEYDQLSIENLVHAVESATSRKYNPPKNTGAVAEAAELITRLLKRPYN